MVSPRDQATLKWKSPAANRICPTMAPLADHLTCPLRIMCTVSIA
jgi:hypothetical protein